MAYNTIDYTVEDHILTITLDRPEQLNSFTVEMSKELVDAFQRADQDDDVRVVVVTGRGRAFCAGMDLTGGEGDSNAFGLDTTVSVEDNIDLIRDTGGTVTLAIYDCRKPVIAAINGPAVGIGLTMTLAMDIRLTTAKAKLGFVFARRGLCTEACSSWFLPRLVGVQQALEWLYTGDIFTGEEALKGGLVRSLHEKDEVLTEAYSIAKNIAQNSSSLSVALMRQLVYKMLGADHPMEAHKLDSRGMFYTSTGPDGKEGVDSFMEKRPPNFTASPTKDMPDFYPWWDEREYK